MIMCVECKIILYKLEYLTFIKTHVVRSSKKAFLGKVKGVMPHSKKNE